MNHIHTINVLQRAGGSRVTGGRRGLSIMEVLFAIGVLMIGLLGIASILPVATNNAARALQQDKAIEEVNNRMAFDVAKIGTQINSVIVGNNSQSIFPTFRDRFREVPFPTVAIDPFWNARLVSTGYSSAAVAGLPNAFCVDPWFLTAANNLRDDSPSNPNTNRNGYDRTVFPCYDPRYTMVESPSEAISESVGDGWNTPRFTRVALSFEGRVGAPAFAVAESLARDSDTLALRQPDDKTLPPGLFVQVSANNALRKGTASGRTSSIVMMSRTAANSNSFNAAVVTMQDRKVVTVAGNPTLAHQLTPYTAARFDAINPADDALTYSGEIFGFVTFAPNIFQGGGGGEFVYQHSAFMDPDVDSGDWLMLARRDYTLQGATVVPGMLRFAWYQVTAVAQKPTLLAGDQIETRVAVRGPDWVFHPSQVPIDPTNLSLGYSPPYSTGGGNGPTSPNPPEYNYSATGDPNYGTIVVLMPDVISVQQFQVQL